MLYQIKMFQDNNFQTLEKKVNEWLENNQGLVIVQVTQSETIYDGEPYITIAVTYGV